jgi:hypothetical protein
MQPSAVPTETGVTRRMFLRGATALALGAALKTAAAPGLLMPSPARAAGGLETAAGPIVPGCDAGRLEQLTRQRLARMEKEVAGILARRDVFSGTQLRQWIIRLLMWGPAAGLSRETLGFLGDHPDILHGTPLLAPLVRWLSEPYIFPLETGGTAKTPKAELDRVFAFMARQQGRGRATTLDNVGDASLSPADADAYERYYLLLIDTFAGRKLGNQLFLSLKLSALVYDLEAALGGAESAQTKRREIKDRLARLLAAAAAVPGNKRVFLRLDMEEHAFKDLIII